MGNMWDALTKRNFIAGMAAAAATGCRSMPAAGPRLLYRDDFRSGLGQWVVEAERPGRIEAAGGVLDVDVPNGVTLWFRAKVVLSMVRC